MRKFVLLAISLVIITFSAWGVLANKVEKAPDDKVLTALIHNTIITLNNANLTNNYAVFRELCADTLKKKTTTQTFATAFKSLRETGADLSQVVMFPPTLSEEPSISARGVLSLKGYYPTKPLQTQFKLGFIKQGDKWRLAKVTVALSKAKQNLSMTSSSGAKPTIEPWSTASTKSRNHPATSGDETDTKNPIQSTYRPTYQALSTQPIFGTNGHAKKSTDADDGATTTIMIEPMPRSKFSNEAAVKQKPEPQLPKQKVAHTGDADLHKSTVTEDSAPKLTQPAAETSPAKEQKTSNLQEPQTQTPVKTTAPVSVDKQEGEPTTQKSEMVRAPEPHDPNEIVVPLPIKAPEQLLANAPPTRVHKRPVVRKKKKKVAEPISLMSLIQGNF